MAEEIYSDDIWARFATQFLRFETTTTRDQATALLETANHALSLSKATGVVDFGCGNGAAIKELLRAWELGTYGSAPRDCRLLAFDSSAGSVAQLKRLQATKTASAGSHPLWGLLETEVANAVDLSPIVPTASISHVLSSFGLYVMPDGARDEAARILQPGGVLAVISFGGVTWLDPFRATLRQVRPDKTLPVPGPEWKGVEAVLAHLRAMGLERCCAREATFYMPYERAADMVEWGLKTAPGLQTLMRELSEEERHRWVELTVRHLEEHYRDNRLPTSAILASGVKPMG